MSNRKNLLRLEAHLAATVAVAALVGAADAGVVTWDANLSIPANFDGYYINVVSQTFGTSGSAVSGWHINPYGATSLSFFASSGTSTTFVRLGASGGPTNLAEGYVVGASSTFANSTSNVFAAGSPSGWQLNAINYFGFRFSTADGIRYGFGKMEVGATAATRTLLSVSYEDSGGSITVPAPGALALLGAAGLLGGRRRRS